MKEWNPALTGYELESDMLPSNARALNNNHQPQQKTNISIAPKARELTPQEAQQRAMEFNRLEAQKARNWQEKMYGSRYQMTMRDIKKAGLNPYILNQFSPGGFSSGSAAQIASNITSSRNKSKNETKATTTTSRANTPLEWISGLLPIATTIIGGIIGGIGGASVGSAVGGLGARALKNRKK